MMPKQVQPLSVAAQGCPVMLAQLLPGQHGCVVEQLWPTSEQVPPSPTGVGVPMSPVFGGGGGAPWQVPLVEPLTTTHARPVQQSELAVQTWPFIEHIDPQRRTPMLSGRQGAPLQHSDEKVHCWPCMMQHGGWPV
jgi:hypothetical protein